MIIVLFSLLLLYFGITNRELTPISFLFKLFSLYLVSVSASIIWCYMWNVISFLIRNIGIKKKGRRYKHHTRSFDHRQVIQIIVVSNNYAVVGSWSGGSGRFCQPVECLIYFLSFSVEDSTVHPE